MFILTVRFSHQTPIHWNSLPSNTSSLRVRYSVLTVLYYLCDPVHLPEVNISNYHNCLWAFFTSSWSNQFSSQMCKYETSRILPFFIFSWQSIALTWSNLAHPGEPEASLGESGFRKWLKWPFCPPIWAFSAFFTKTSNNLLSREATSVEQLNSAGEDQKINKR